MSIHLAAPIALIDVLPTLLAAFERVHGAAVTTTFLLNPEIPGHILAGARFDIAISNPVHLAPLIAAGLAGAESHRAFVRSPLVFARLGPGPDPARTEADIAACLRAAPSLAYTGTGTSGAMLDAVLARLGLAEVLAQRLMPMGGGAPRRALVAGECALAALPHSNAAAIPGASIAAICPWDWDVQIDMSLVLHTRAPRSARALAAYLLDPARDAGLHAAGAERFRLSPQGPP